MGLPETKGKWLHTIGVTYSEALERLPDAIRRLQYEGVTISISHKEEEGANGILQVTAPDAATAQTILNLAVDVLQGRGDELCLPGSTLDLQRQRRKAQEQRHAELIQSLEGAWKKEPFWQSILRRFVRMFRE